MTEEVKREKCKFEKTNGEKCKRYSRIDGLCKLHHRLKPTECSICYAEILPTQQCSLNCAHSFHRLCIHKWADKKEPKDDVTCPMCRAPFEKSEVELKIIAICDMKKKGRGFQFQVQYEGHEELIWIPGKKMQDEFLKRKGNGIGLS